MSNTGNRAASARRDTAACTGHPDPDAAASQGLTDAMDLITDIRDLDPRQIWGRLEQWTLDDPQRLIAATVVLAAWSDPNATARTALAWTEDLVSWRGVA
jgi:hypothetical protein